ncbi:MAG: helix-turn-helix transcriptional regulator [Lachnospiraceae bacterium]|nr:helix-turn-helix transcriptional regulator [Lachnospiraceae bacterium]
MNTIHFVGYSAVHPSDFLFDMTSGPGQYLLLLVFTPVQFLLDGQWQEYPAGTAMLYAPGQPICYRACQETYQNDWLRFSSDDPLVTQFPLMGTPFPVSDPEYCHLLFKLLTWETSLSSADSDLTISNLLQALFLRLRQDTFRRESTSHASQLLYLHKKIYNNPQLPWNIRSMAQEMHLSAGYLQILYRKMFGVSCMDDVIAGRIRKAREQLAYTEKPVSEIADDCGYHNVEHFCRQFRQQTGLTPGAFRRSFLRNAALPGAAKRETTSEKFSETVPYPKYAEPTPFISLSHYNVAGPEIPSDAMDSDGNILPPHGPQR